MKCVVIAIFLLTCLFIITPEVHGKPLQKAPYHDPLVVIVKQQRKIRRLHKRISALRLRVSSLTKRVSDISSPKESTSSGPSRIEATATAYCLTGTTATGSRAGPGTIAVDPSVIPLGTNLYVEGYGEGEALDTGSAITGSHIDLWMGCEAAVQWGIRTVKVTVR